MKHLFVPYELAKALKELGFDEPCLTAYIPEETEVLDVFDQEEAGYYSNSELRNGVVAAPTHQQVVDWFREKHKIEVCASSYYYPKHYGIVSQIGYSHKSNTEYPESDYGEGLGKRQKHEKVIVYSERNFDDYYSALNAAIDEAIDIVKQV